MQIITFPITLVESFMISPKVKHFIFKCDLSPAFTYQPGQFITIHFSKEGKDLKRSYSLANPPQKDNRIEFAAGYVDKGPGTELLFNLKPGEQININGPFGRLICKPENPARYIFVATSTGVTPYRAMLPELEKRLEADKSLKIVVLLGVQKREDVLYGSDFLQLAEKFPQQVQFHACLSREHETQLVDHELHGYVQEAFPQLNLDPNADLVYLCGNPGMIDASFQFLQEKGFAIQSIIREKYISR